MAPGFDDEDDDFEDGGEGIEPMEPAALLPVGGEVEETWDAADFDEDFDDDFESEPDEDLERFESELNDESVDGDACGVDEELDEDF